jgi:hypothetical protein
MPTFYDIAENVRRRNRSNLTPGAETNYQYGPFGANAQNSAPAGLGGQTSFIPGDYYVPPGLRQDPEFNPYVNEDANQFWYEEADPTKKHASFSEALEATGGDPEMERKVAMMNYQEAQKRQAQRQAIAMKILQEQRMRERNRMVAAGQQQQRQMQWQDRQEKKQETREAEALSAYGSSGLRRYATNPTPQNKQRIISGFRGTPEQQSAYGWALDSAARKEADYQTSKAYTASERQLKEAGSYAGLLTQGSQSGWDAAGVKLGQFPARAELNYVERAKFFNTEQNDHESAAKSVLESFNRSLKKLPDYIKKNEKVEVHGITITGNGKNENPNSAYLLQNKMTDLVNKGQNFRYFQNRDSDGQFLNPYTKGNTYNTKGGHRWGKNGKVTKETLLQPADEPDEPSPFTQGAPQPAMPTRPGMRLQRPPRWEAEKEELEAAGNYDDRDWIRAGIPSSKWPTEVGDFYEERTAEGKRERATAIRAGRTDEARAIIKQREEREQAWTDKVAAGTAEREEAETLREAQFRVANPTHPSTQRQYNNDGGLEDRDRELVARFDAIANRALLATSRKHSSSELDREPTPLDDWDQHRMPPVPPDADGNWIYDKSNGWVWRPTESEPAPSQFFDSTNALTADVTQTGTNVSQTVVDQAGTNALTADVIQPDQPDGGTGAGEDWLTSLSTEDQETLIANSLDFAGQIRENQLELLSDSQWRDEFEREVARLAFPNEELATALQIINTREWLDSGAMGNLEGRALNNLRKRFRTARSDDPNRSGDNRQQAADLIRQHGR